MARYNGSGWHFQSQRHSNARRTGKAGGTYANNSTPRSREISENISKGLYYSKMQKKYGYVPKDSDVVELPIYQINGKQYYRDVRLGEYRNVKNPSDTLDINIPNSMLEKPTIPYPKMKDSDGDGVPDKYDCQPKNPKKQDKIVMLSAPFKSTVAKYYVERKGKTGNVTGEWEEGYFTITKSDKNLDLKDDDVTDIEDKIREEHRDDYSEDEF